jgi:FdhD protein
MPERKLVDPATEPAEYTRWHDGASESVRGLVPSERAVTLFVNGGPLVGINCSPSLLEELALGFLFNEGLIETMRDIAVLDVRADGGSIDVWLEGEVEVPALRFLTAGCSGGTSSGDLASGRQRVESDLRIRPSLVRDLVGEQLSAVTPLHRAAGGLHGAMLADGERVLCAAEDIGRHNAVDKVAGICLRQSWPTQDRIIVSTGRASSEVVAKAARMQVPVVISRSSPTSLSVQLAREWGITLVGYARRGSFRVYAGEGRIAV